MATRKKEKKYTLEMDGLTIQVVQKSMRSIRFTVYPPDGRVRVAAPIHLNVREIQEYIEKRLPWIHKQKERLESMDFVPEPEYSEGELHFLLGRKYPLRFGNVRGASLKGRFLELPGSLKGRKKEIERSLDGLYRSALKDFMERRIPVWEKAMSVKVHARGVRKMKTLWGSCNIRTHRIWLNLELARMSEKCIESILVHEMVHLKERLHNRRFYSLMDRYLPDWKEREKELKEGGIRYY
ncbi:MAG: metal-dependent hydrolase [Leptospiraceae bacterium]|nr:metal-dependent hydrolase [Leptospiraceae bacterium]